MIDFIIATVVTVFTNIYIIVPCWDKLKEHWIETGKTAEQIATPYNLLCLASYLAVGLLVYFIIWLVKLIIKNLNK